MCFLSPSELYPVLVIPMTDGYVNAQDSWAFQGVQPGAAGFGARGGLETRRELRLRVHP